MARTPSVNRDQRSESAMGPRHFGSIAIGLGLLTFCFSAAQAAGAVALPAPRKSAAIDRIKASGTLRAGVAAALPWLGQNPTTREFFGPSIDMGKELASRLGV